MRLADLIEARNESVKRTDAGLLIAISRPMYDILSGNRARLKRAKDKAGSNDTLVKNRKLVHQPIRYKLCRFVGSIPLAFPEGEDA